MVSLRQVEWFYDTLNLSITNGFLRVLRHEINDENPMLHDICGRFKIENKFGIVDTDIMQMPSLFGVRDRI